MRKIILFVFLLILNGCSFTNLFVGGEVDKVTVVKYAPYMKHHRAYFARTQLKTIRGGKKYLYLYNAKTNDIGVLLHRKNQYTLYNMSDPKQKPLVINVNSKQKYWQVLKTFRHKGYKLIKSLASVGYTASVSRKRYKGAKTLLIETKEYSQLQSLYQSAIKNYTATKVQTIKTKLPKVLISTYYLKYKKRAQKRAQLIVLKKIANKLDLAAPKVPTQKNKLSSTPSKKPKPIQVAPIIKVEKPVIVQEVQKKQEESTAVPEVAIQKEIVQRPVLRPVTSKKTYRYYIKRAPLSELSTYIANRKTKKTLSYNQYNRLKRKERKLKEENLVKHGSLEELIAAYKVNKTAKYKRRIMSLMKVKQSQN